jgi:hypothetical protein
LSMSLYAPTATTPPIIAIKKRPIKRFIIFSPVFVIVG